jgi:hypothetical protein
MAPSVDDEKQISQSDTAVGMTAADTQYSPLVVPSLEADSYLHNLQVVRSPRDQLRQQAVRRRLRKDNLLSLRVGPDSPKTRRASVPARTLIPIGGRAACPSRGDETSSRLVIVGIARSIRERRR